MLKFVIYPAYGCESRLCFEVVATLADWSWVPTIMQFASVFALRWPSTVTDSTRLTFSVWQRPHARSTIGSVPTPVTHLHLTIRTDSSRRGRQAASTAKWERSATGPKACSMHAKSLDLDQRTLFDWSSSNDATRVACVCLPWCTHTVLIRYYSWLSHHWLPEVWVEPITRLA